MTDLLDRARTWAAADPDPFTKAEIERLIEANDLVGLEPAFGDDLVFGTAGIRGVVGAGPARMNRAVVIRTTSGLASYLARSGGGMVVVGFDARPSSRGFAEDVAGVLAAAGIEVRYWMEPTPTPLVAYAAKYYQASAAVVITASHNPPQDNGYKVYGPDAAQIIPPVDTRIEELIKQAPAAMEVPRVEVDFSSPSSELVGPVPPDLFARYESEVETVRPQPATSSLKIVYTPMHGVGGEWVARLLYQGGHHGVIPVPEQIEPDGTFPTVAFPNPEEPGSLDLALETALRDDADMVIANDPDADRLAAAAPLEGEWRPLSGNDLGCLLADFVLRYSSGVEMPIVISSIVSSPMLTRIADRWSARHESTLTGFKWIVSAGMSLETVGEGTFVFGYEEALGYTVGPVVRDKDGMSAALIFCDLVAHLADEGQTVWNRLEDVWRDVGVWASAQHSVVGEGPGGLAELASAIERVGENPPKTIGDLRVSGVVDYRKDAETRPTWLGAQNLIELELGSAGRVLVRPSGTEPKIKVYVDLTERAGESPLGQQTALQQKAATLAASVARSLQS